MKAVYGVSVLASLAGLALGQDGMATLFLVAMAKTDSEQLLLRMA